MGKRATYTPMSDYQDEIRSLKTDLYMTREAMVRLMDEPTQEILKSYRELIAPKRVWTWAEEAAGKVLDTCTDVEQATYEGMPWGSPRAMCPLCGQETSSPYEIRTTGRVNAPSARQPQLVTVQRL